jgi:hypothetical protein
MLWLRHRQDEYLLHQTNETQQAQHQQGLYRQREEHSQQEKQESKQVQAIQQFEDLYSNKGGDVIPIMTT